jgi:hypothetical protein
MQEALLGYYVGPHQVYYPDVLLLSRLKTDNVTGLNLYFGQQVSKAVQIPYV